MKASEFRIGNIIDILSLAKPVRLPINHPHKIMTIGFGQVEVVGYDKIPAREEKWPTLQIHEVTPIPLTAEWLERFGFKKDEMLEYYQLRVGDVAYHEGDKNGFLEVVLDSEELPVRVRYVHQLQNLHFALCGTELELKP